MTLDLDELENRGMADDERNTNPQVVINCVRMTEAHVDLLQEAIRQFKPSDEQQKRLRYELQRSMIKNQSLNAPNGSAPPEWFAEQQEDELP